MSREFPLYRIAGMVTMAVLALCAAFMPDPGQARSPGQLDPSWGSDGLTVLAFGDKTAGSTAAGLVKDPEGRIMQLGSSSSGKEGLISRNLADGSPDSTFGNEGTAAVPGLLPRSIDFQPDGRPVIAGLAAGEPALARLNGDGSLDASFGTGGISRIVWDPPAKLFSGFARSDARVIDLQSVAVLTSGDIVAAGPVGGCYRDDPDGYPQTGCDQFVAIGADSGGAPLADFGATGGIRYFSFYGDVIGNMAFAADVAPDGLIRLGLYSIADSTNGGLDAFVNVATMPARSSAEAEWIADHYPDAPPIARAMVGVLSGGPGMGGPDFGGPGPGGLTLDGDLTYAVTGEALVRFGADGAPDPAFGSRGVVALTAATYHGSIGNRRMIGQSVAIDDRDRVVVSGLFKPSPGSSAFAARFNASGEPDPTFSNDGFAAAWQGSGGSLVNRPSLVVSGDRYLLGGTHTNKGSSRALLMAIDGSAGRSYRCGGRAATWIGTDGDDEVRLTNGVVVTLGGKDRVTFLKRETQQSVTCAGPGNDRVETIGGIVYGGPGNDDLSGITSEKGRFLGDRLYGGPGNDVIKGKSGSDVISGGPGNDRLYGGSGRDQIRGGPGRDLLKGGAGTDRLIGGPGRDRLDGGPVGPPLDRYVTRAGAKTSVSIIASGRKVHNVLVGSTIACQPFNPDCQQGRFGYFQFNDHRFKGRKQMLKGHEWDADEYDADTFDQRIEARKRGRVVTGKVRFTIPSPHWRAHWTGQSLRNPWVGFRAFRQPKDRQIVKQ